MSKTIRKLKQHIKKGIEFLWQLLCLMFIELLILFCLFFMVSWAINI